MFVGAVVRPGVAARFVRGRRRAESPFFFAGFGVEGGQASADAVLAAGAADVDLAVVVERGRGDREALAGFDDVGAPDDFAGFLVERDLGAVQLRDVDHAVADRDAAVVPTAADDFAERVGGKVGFVGPEAMAAFGVDREDVVGTVRDVDRPVVDERLALGGELGRGGVGADLGHPFALEFADVFGVDFAQRREPVVGRATTVGDPVFARIFEEFFFAEFRRQGDAVGGGDGFAFVRFFAGRRFFGRRGRAGDDGGGVVVPGEVTEEEACDEGDCYTHADRADRDRRPEFESQVFLFHRSNLSEVLVPLSERSHFASDAACERTRNSLI